MNKQPPPARTQTQTPHTHNVQARRLDVSSARGCTLHWTSTRSFFWRLLLEAVVLSRGAELGRCVDRARRTEQKEVQDVAREEEEERDDQERDAHSSAVSL